MYWFIYSFIFFIHLFIYYNIYEYIFYACRDRRIRPYTDRNRAGRTKEKDTEKP